MLWTAWVRSGHHHLDEAAHRKPVAGNCVCLGRPGPFPRLGQPLGSAEPPVCALLTTVRRAYWQVDPLGPTSRRARAQAGRSAGDPVVCRRAITATGGGGTGTRTRCQADRFSLVPHPEHQGCARRACSSSRSHGAGRRWRLRSRWSGVRGSTQSGQRGERQDRCWFVDVVLLVGDGLPELASFEPGAAGLGMVLP